MRHWGRAGRWGLVEGWSGPLQFRCRPSSSFWAFSSSFSLQHLRRFHRWQLRHRLLRLQSRQHGPRRASLLRQQLLRAGCPWTPPLNVVSIKTRVVAHMSGIHLRASTPLAVLSTADILYQEYKDQKEQKSHHEALGCDAKAKLAEIVRSD